MVSALLLGLLIREVFSFWTGHPSDFELWVRLGYGVNQGGNPYGVLSTVPGLSFANVFTGMSGQNQATIAYLPFWPFVTGLMFEVYSLAGLNNRFAYYFLLKQPVIAGDLVLAYLLYLYVSKRMPERSFWVLWFWLLSPFTIIIAGIWGMFDSIAMAFVMISILTSNYLRRGFWTGLATFAKSVPVIYAVPTTIEKRRSLFGLVVAVGFPALLSAATFYVMGWPFPSVESALASSVVKGGDSMSLWDVFFYLNYLGLLPPLTPSVYRILGLLWVPALIAVTLVAFRLFGSETDYGLTQSLILVTLAFLIFKARVTEQYAIYLLALALIDVAIWNPKRRPILLATMLVALIYLLSNNYFLIRFLSPVYPNFTQVESALSERIGVIRYTVNFLSGTMFTYLNVRYFVETLRGYNIRRGLAH